MEGWRLEKVGGGEKGKKEAGEEGDGEKRLGGGEIRHIWSQVIIVVIII